MFWNQGYLEGTDSELSIFCRIFGYSGWAKFTGLKSNTLDSHMQPGGQRSFNRSMKMSVWTLEFLAPLGQPVSLQCLPYNLQWGHIPHREPVHTQAVEINFSRKVLSLTYDTLLFFFYHLKTKYKSWATKSIWWSVCELSLQFENPPPGQEVKAASPWAVACWWEEGREGFYRNWCGTPGVLILVSGRRWERENNVNGICNHTVSLCHF